MSLYKGIVEFNWKNLESQPLYVKSLRCDNKKQGYRMELVADRGSDNEFIGESFSIYGPNIPDLELGTDVSIEVNSDKSTFFQDKNGYGYRPYIVVNKVGVRNADQS